MPKRSKKKQRDLSPMERYGRALSQRLTRHEVIFMRRLSLTGKIQFDFQVRIGPCFADFVFPDRMLIIEVDGSSHIDQRAYDLERDKFMEGLGFTIWRILNREVQTWPLGQLLDYQLQSQPSLTYQQALESAISCHFRPTEKRDRQQESDIEINTPDFYPRLIKKVAAAKGSSLVYEKCSCGTKAIMYDGRLGPHLRTGKGDQCPNGYHA